MTFHIIILSHNNPNGDPLGENKPQIDYNSGYNIVTDVILKRTMRDYLLNYRNIDIFVKEERKANSSVKSKDEKLKDFSSLSLKDNTGKETHRYKTIWLRNSYRKEYSCFNWLSTVQIR